MGLFGGKDKSAGNHFLFSIRDRVAMEFGPPTPLKNRAVAVRWFKYQMEAAKVDIDDYELYEVGLWNSDLGSISPADPVQIPIVESGLVED